MKIYILHIELYKFSLKVFTKRSIILRLILIMDSKETDVCVVHTRICVVISATNCKTLKIPNWDEKKSLLLDFSVVEETKNWSILNVLIGHLIDENKFTDGQANAQLIQWQKILHWMMNLFHFYLKISTMIASVSL